MSDIIQVVDSRSTGLSAELVQAVGMWGACNVVLQEYVIKNAHFSTNFRMYCKVCKGSQEFLYGDLSKGNGPSVLLKKIEVFCKAHVHKPIQAVEFPKFVTPQPVPPIPARINGPNHFELGQIRRKIRFTAG